MYSLGRKKKSNEEKQGRIQGRQLRTGWAGAEMRVFKLFDSCAWTDQRMDQLTNGRRDKGSYRVACPQLKKNSPWPSKSYHQIVTNQQDILVFNVLCAVKKDQTEGKSNKTQKSKHCTQLPQKQITTTTTTMFK